MLSPEDKTEAQIEILQKLGLTLHEIAEALGSDPEKIEEHFERLSKTSSKGGRPPHKPTIKTRAQVETAAAMGCPQDHIAKKLDITRRTLRKHYPNELKFGAHEANLKVMQTLYRQLLSPMQRRAHCCRLNNLKRAARSLEVN